MSDVDKTVPEAKHNHRRPVCVTERPVNLRPHSWRLLGKKWGLFKLEVLLQLKA